MPTSNKTLNEYVKFLNTLNRVEMEGLKIAQGPMGDPMAGGMPPEMMGGGMPPEMMGGAPPMDPGMALGIPGNMDPAALGMIPPMPAPPTAPAEDPAVEEAKDMADKALLEKALDVSDKAMELAQEQTKKVDELLNSMQTEQVMPEPPISPEETDALLAAKANAAEGMM